MKTPIEINSKEKTEKFEAFEKSERALQAALTKSKLTLGPTAPRLLTHKPQVAANALRCGLTGQTVFLTPFEMRDYLTAGRGLIGELQPITQREIHLAQSIVDTQWRFNRCGALETICQTSGAILESQALYEANPHLLHVEQDSVEAEHILAHSHALSLRRQCEGPNVYEKLSRHETRLWRLLCSLNDEYERIHRRGNKAARDAWTKEICPSYTWYNKLTELADQLLEAREELTQKSVVETITISSEGEPVSDAESLPSEAKLFCKKVIRILRPLTKTTIETYEKAHRIGLTSELEESMFPNPAPGGCFQG